MQKNDFITRLKEQGFVQHIEESLYVKDCGDMELLVMVDVKKETYVDQHTAGEWNSHPSYDDLLEAVKTI